MQELSYGHLLHARVSALFLCFESLLMLCVCVCLLTFFSTVNWTVPFQSWLAMSVLMIAMIVTYLIPLRYLILLWGESAYLLLCEWQVLSSRLSKAVVELCCLNFCEKELFVANTSET